MLKSRIMFLTMMIMILEGVLMRAVMGEVYNVGDSGGWTTLVDMDYATWTSSKKFRVGDTLLFHYHPASHNVMQVTQHGFRSCNITAPLKTYVTGNDSFTIKGPGHYFFICGFPGHCDIGQKLNVRVLKNNLHMNISSTTIVGPTKTTASAPKSVAAVTTDTRCLLRSIVGVVFTIYIAMLVA